MKYELSGAFNRGVWFKLECADIKVCVTNGFIVLATDPKNFGSGKALWMARDF